MEVKSILKVFKSFVMHYVKKIISMPCHVNPLGCLNGLGFFSFGEALLTRMVPMLPRFFLGLLE
jgi:hypothetical protein